MTGSAQLIKRYFHTRRSSEFHLIIGQVESITAMAASLLKADFVAVFYRPHDHERLLPLAYMNRPGAEITDLRTLEVQWQDCSAFDCFDTEDPAGPDRIIDCADASGDGFAAQYSFSSVLAQPCVLENNVKALLVAYWRQAPPSMDEDTRHNLEHLLRILLDTMISAEGIQCRNDFNLRLTELIAMADMPVGERHVDELLEEIVSYAEKAVPSAGYGLFIQNTEGEKFKLGASRGDLNPGDEYALALADKLPMLCLKAEAMKSHRCRWVDISDEFAAFHPSVHASVLSLDLQVRVVLVAWSAGEEDLEQNDRELLTAFSLFAQTIIKDALIVKNLTQSNRILRKSSHQLANFETLAALADMTSGIAHDFNNIFGGVVGRIQLIKLRAKDESLKADLDKAESLLMEGAETLKRLQTFTTSARQKKTRLLDLRELIESYLQRDDSVWKKLAAEKKVRVDLDCSYEQALVEGHDLDLLMMLDKLIDNAVEHAHDNSTVTISFGSNSKYYMLSVENHGAPVPLEIQGKVFYPFFTTKHIRGAGLGLSVVHGIVVRHGGKVDFSSRDGITRVSVWLMMAERMNDVSEITRKSAGERKLRILVVDDDVQIREVLSDMLAIDGHHPTACADGFAALKAFDKAEYDLVITDLGMPGMSGLELAGTVHRSKPQLPIAMITGWGTQLNEDEVAMNGIKAVLPKPFHLSDIKKLVENLVTA